ncbi:auxiliary transport protein, MFP family, putative [Coleofasciculus chthonoplastes PCC 7420]|uniref:Auxiliary transport protein, MFP family, putative n=1 Tax=Coleofasciculus chthonoplastes PCC 7420 TaxID=118168 RepID=B4W4A2_9CYAN|nr:efflux RND transporter periplasmic adaptor subunit [Coleofasciculus chthonoplastes]EDX71025.1 auxiliary transport protein, MFP family, putative [Coleofasciculus chthonoplastes PCC 7420]
MGKVNNPLPWIMGIITASLLVAGGAGYFVIAAKPDTVDLDELTVPVDVQDLAVRITANGTVQPIQTVNLSPKTSGRLVKLEVEQGDRVDAGDVVAVMEQEDVKARFLAVRADLKQAQARLAEAKAGPRPEEIKQAEQRLYQAKARLAEALVGNPSEINQAIAQVQTASSRFDLARVRFRRYKYLVEEGVVSQDQFQEVFAEARTAKAQLDEAQQRLEQVRETKNTETSPEIFQLNAAVKEAEFALQQLVKGTRKEEIAQFEAAVEAAKAQTQAAYIQLQDTIIRAPFPGIITQKYATVGAFVTPTTSASSTASATSTSIVALATKQLEVLAEVPEVDIGQIQEKQPVQVISDAFPDQAFRGQVRLVAPEAVVQNDVTSFQVRVALAPEAQEKLRSGMNVDLTFLGKPISDALVVPTVAVVTQEGETGVMVPDFEDQPKFKPVTIGATIEDKTQIIRGLREGEKVFIDLPENYNPDEEE